MSPPKTCLSILLFAVWCPVAHAQDEHGPRVVWNNDALPDSVRMEALGRLVWEEYLFVQPDSALLLLDEQMELAERMGSPRWQGDAFKNKGIAWKLLGHEENALASWEQGVAVFRQAGDEQGVARVQINMGILHMERGRYPEALDHLLDALRRAEIAGNARLIATAQANLGAIHKDLRDAPQAKVHLEEGIATFRAMGDSASQIPLLGNLSDVYEQLGDTALAQATLEECLRLATVVGNAQWVAIAGSNLGVLLERSDPRAALEQFDRVLDFFDGTGDPVGRASVRVHMARAWLRLGDRGRAEALAREGYAIAMEAGANRQSYDAAEVLYRVLRDKGDLAGALRMFERSVSLRDSVVGEEQRRELMRQQFAYAFDKKEALLLAEQEKKDALAIAELRRERLRRNAFLGGFGSMVLLATMFLVQRNRIGREKRRSEELLLNILPEQVAMELKAKGAAEARQIDLVTVLFTDFKGFTAMSEQVSPRQLVKDLHECFSAFDLICAKHGVEKIKTIGDAYMAAGGVPVPNSTHAIDVINAALEIRDFVAEGRARKIAAGLPYFEIRIGIHSGPVVAGIVGVRKFQYDIWGDTVNTASRMESSGEVGKVNISEVTYEMVKDETVVNGEWELANGKAPRDADVAVHSPVTNYHSPAFTFTPRGRIQAKGKGEMAMFFVRRSSEGA
jgi:adenylate cyclase